MASVPLKFEVEDLLNSALVGPDGTVEYTTASETKSKSRGPTTTIVAKSGLRGVIDRRAKTFEIGGATRPTGELKRRLKHGEREWKWSESKIHYLTRYSWKDHEWTMRVIHARPTWGWDDPTDEFVEPQPVARFTPNSRVLSFASAFQNDALATERLFLLMVLLSSEIRRKDSLDDDGADGSGVIALIASIVQVFTN
ncbi:hypothetical protein C8R44DRAFT_744919 [Mycena epipterygia]|nr:hypothetical protein C8R44DRAFT_744919 [Mycena epipterygia]